MVLFICWLMSKIAMFKCNGSEAARHVSIDYNPL